MSVKDIIKSSFLQQYQTENMSVKMMLFYLLAAALIGAFIFAMYKLLTVKTFYSRDFNLSLMLMCVITAAIIITVQNSIVVSLGMVGALSIVRFRTAVKEPLDLGFLFWAISAGIITGARMVGLAVALSAVVTVLLLIFRILPDERQSCLLVVKADNPDMTEEVTDIIRKYGRKFTIKSRTMTKEALDMVFELRFRDYGELTKELNAMKDIRSVSLISHRAAD